MHGGDVLSTGSDFRKKNLAYSTNCLAKAVSSSGLLFSTFCEGISALKSFRHANLAV